MWLVHINNLLPGRYCFHLANVCIMKSISLSYVYFKHSILLIFQILKDIEWSSYKIQCLFQTLKNHILPQKGFGKMGVSNIGVDDTSFFKDLKHSFSFLFYFFLTKGEFWLFFIKLFFFQDRERNHSKCFTIDMSIMKKY